jgi:hypothetical protein
LKTTVAYKQLNALPAQTPEEVFLSCVKGISASSHRRLESTSTSKLQPSTSTAGSQQPEHTQSTPEKKQRSTLQEKQRQKQQRLQALQAQWRGEKPAATPSTQGQGVPGNEAITAAAVPTDDCNQIAVQQSDGVASVDPLKCTIGELLSQMHEKRCLEEAKKSTLPPKNGISTLPPSMSSGDASAPGTEPPGTGVAYNQYMSDPVYTAQYTQYYNYYAAQGMVNNQQLKEHLLTFEFLA